MKGNICYSGEGLDTVTQKPSSKLMFGYSNDNFLFGTEINKLVGAKLIPDYDDHVTAGFYLDYRREFSNAMYGMDLFYHILTVKEKLFRTDILALRLSYEYALQRFRYRFGLGYHLTGNLGGSTVQNTYHQLFNIKEVHLNYDPNRTDGVRASFRMEYVLLSFSQRSVVSLFGSSMVSSNEIPDALRLGTSYASSFSEISINAIGGYVRRFEIETAFVPIFGSAWFAGIMGEYSLTEKIDIGAWIFQDQYSQQGEMHFGMNITWKDGKSTPTMLKDVIFP